MGHYTSSMYGFGAFDAVVVCFAVDSRMGYKSQRITDTSTH